MPGAMLHCLDGLNGVLCPLCFCFFSFARGWPASTEFSKSMTYRSINQNKKPIVDEKGGKLPLEMPMVPMDLTMALERGGLQKPKARKKKIKNSQLFRRGEGGRGESRRVCQATVHSYPASCPSRT